MINNPNWTAILKSANTQDAKREKAKERLEKFKWKQKIKKLTQLCVVAFFSMYTNTNAFEVIKVTKKMQRRHVEQIINDAFNFIKPFEGFKRKCFWDYGAHSIGYGTRCKYRNEIISKQEAERRAKSHIRKDLNTLLANFDGQDIHDIDHHILISSLSIMYHMGARGFTQSLLFKITQIIQEDVDIECNVIYHAFINTISQNKPQLYGIYKRRLAEMNLMIQNHTCKGGLTLNVVPALLNDSNVMQKHLIFTADDNVVYHAITQ